jgi:hypothetical protein
MPLSLKNVLLAPGEVRERVFTVNYGIIRVAYALGLTYQWDNRCSHTSLFGFTITNRYSCRKTAAAFISLLHHLSLFHSLFWQGILRNYVYMIPNTITYNMLTQWNMVQTLRHTQTNCRDLLSHSICPSLIWSITSVHNKYYYYMKISSIFIELPKYSNICDINQ